MQLTELLFQRVKDLGAQGQLALRPGYVAVVSPSSVVRTALVAPLFPGPDDSKRLAAGGGTTRVGVGLRTADGQPYRLLRELGGNRQLQKFDSATKKFALLTEDALEIDSFLRVELGLPSAEHYAGFFVLEASELPSIRAKAAAGQAQASLVDQDRAKVLKEELEATKRFEGLQDRLYKVQQRLHELGELENELRAAEDELAAVEDKARRSQWTEAQIADLTRRAQGVKDAQKRRDDAVAEVITRRQQLARRTPQPPEPLLKDAMFLGGLGGGVAIDLLAVLFAKAGVLFLGLLPFAIALGAVLRWIAADEADKAAAQTAKDLKAKEEAIKKGFTEEQAPLREAMKVAQVDSVSDLLDLFKERKEVLAQLEAAKARVAEVKKHPDVSRIPVERPLLESEKAKLEEGVGAHGFARPVAEIELDLKAAMGLGERRGGPIISDAELPKNWIQRASELLMMPVDELWPQLGPRLTAYLGALSDKRIAGAKLEANGQLMLAAPDGRAGAFQTLPPGLRDLAYTALRLTLLERACAFKKVTVVIDDAFAPLEPPKRALVGKMLKAIGQQTQVIHRMSEAPAQGAADHVVQAPGQAA